MGSEILSEKYLSAAIEGEKAVEVQISTSPNAEADITSEGYLATTIYIAEEL